MFGALAYNQNKVDSEEAKVLFSNKMLLSEDHRFFSHNVKFKLVFIII